MPLTFPPKSFNARVDPKPLQTIPISYSYKEANHHLILRSNAEHLTCATQARHLIPSPSACNANYVVNYVNVRNRNREVHGEKERRRLAFMRSRNTRHQQSWPCKEPYAGPRMMYIREDRAD